MADLTTFTRAKDWAIVLLVGLVLSLLGVVAAENKVHDTNSSRLTRVEESFSSHAQEMSRRLERIEDKIDNLDK